MFENLELILNIFFLSKSNNEAVGRPGIARSRAIQKRKETLLQEYKIRNKSNVFVDKRIGEKDADLSAEDKMIARCTMERMKNSGEIFETTYINTPGDPV